MPTPVIDISEVSKTFTIPKVRRETVREHALDFFRPSPKERLVVLDHVTCRIGRGESVGLMGRNGSGKSTLLKIASGIYEPDEGRVLVDDVITPILELGVGFNPELDAVDNVYLLGTIMGLTLAQIRASLDEVLRFAGVERFARLKLQHFSSGMAARLAYSIAFSAARGVLILDEIFAVGDAGFQARCEERYEELVAAGHTVLMVSHDPESISRLCSRALLLEGGRIALDADAAMVAERYVELVAGRVPGSPVNGSPEDLA